MNRKSGRTPDTRGDMIAMIAMIQYLIEEVSELDACAACYLTLAQASLSRALGSSARQEKAAAPTITRSAGSV